LVVQIGFTHGSAAKLQIERCIAFYGELFMTYSKREWPQVRETARGFDVEIKKKWPRYHEEIRGKLGLPFQIICSIPLGCLTLTPG
jgi:isopenicillin-N N-acyltransferase-like protein